MHSLYSVKYLSTKNCYKKIKKNKKKKEKKEEEERIRIKDRQDLHTFKFHFIYLLR